MLASTVQFSNNDQPPITPEQHSEFTGAGIEGVHSLRHPTACPTPSPLHLAFHAEAVLATRAGQVCRVVNVPPMS
jgi:hypothetical protein